MFIETWVAKATAGKFSEAVDMWKRYAQAAMRQQPKMRSRIFHPETGNMNTILAMNEFESYADRLEFWENLGDEMQALIAETQEKKLFMHDSMDHYYFDEFK